LLPPPAAHQGLEKPDMVEQSAYPTEGIKAPLIDSRPQVLVADDEKSMRDIMTLSLQRLGYVITAVDNGVDAIEMVRNRKFDLVMLDVMMPGKDGFVVCQELRRFTDVPIFMLTALNRPEDIVRGLELGADNYITKPFNFKELEARIRATLRRIEHRSTGVSFDVAEYGDLKLFNATLSASVAGRAVELTPTEFALLRYLASHAERPVSKEELLQEVWGYADASSQNLVELAARRLRTKIEDDPSSPTRLITVRGVGYRYEVQGIGS
jgi:DNA-binding response OmpR family regulator